MVSLDFMEDLFLSMLLALVSGYGGARLVCSPSLVPVLMCSLPNLCPSVSFYIAASANEVLPIPMTPQSQPLTFNTVLSGL